jgi:hypothetical protein
MVRLYIIDVNLERRHLNDAQRVQLAMNREPLEAERAKQRLSEAGKLGRNIQLGVSSNELTPGFEGQARDLAAKSVGVKSTTYHRMKAFLTLLSNIEDHVRIVIDKGEKGFQPVLGSNEHHIKAPLTRHFDHACWKL